MSLSSCLVCPHCSPQLSLVTPPCTVAVTLHTYWHVVGSQCLVSVRPELTFQSGHRNGVVCCERCLSSFCFVCCLKYKPVTSPWTLSSHWLCGVHTALPAPDVPAFSIPLRGSVTIGPDSEVFLLFFKDSFITFRVFFRCSQAFFLLFSSFKRLVCLPQVTPRGRLSTERRKTCTMRSWT